MYKKLFCHLFRFLPITLLMLQAHPSYAQTLHVSAELDTAEIRIGEQTNIHLKIWSDQNFDPKKISWPKFADTLIKGIQIVRVSKIDSLHPDKNHSDGEEGQIQSLLITSFDSGYYAIPPFRFIPDGDSSKSLLTDAMLLHVQCMPVDTTLAIKDIKPPLKEPFDWRELIPWIKWIAGGIVLVAAIIFLIRYLGKKKTLIKKEEAPFVLPHVLALEKLEKLREQKLWQDGKLKQYHSDLTDIIRLYIEQRFKINALEQTSDEILRSFQSVDLSPECKSKLKQLFILADLVKFAKQQTLPDENEMSMNNAIAFVLETKIEEQSFSAPTNI